MAVGIVQVAGRGLPIPPIITTEVGAFAGAVLGALLGAVCSSRMGRYTLLGLLAGGLLGAATALHAGAWACGLAALRYALLGAFVGWQAGAFVQGGPPACGGGPRSIVER